MITIHLQHLLFHAKHGLYNEEKIVSNEFEVEVKIIYRPPTIPITEMVETINYVSIYELVKKRMNQPKKLLETFVSETALEILNQFKMVEEVFISIKKSNPPIINFQGSIGVSFKLTRAELS